MTHEHTNNSAENHQLHISEAGRRERAVAVRSTLTMGRDNENDIVLESMTVSRCHAVLLRDADGVLLIDLESTNGTLLNGRHVPPDEPVRLADGDEIRLGLVVARYAAPRKAADSAGGHARLAPRPQLSALQTHR